MLDMDTWESAWTAVLFILSGGLIVGKLTEKPRIPDVAAYLLFGIAVGPFVFHWFFEPAQSQTTQFIVNLGATLILFDGGRSVSFSILKDVWISIALLATFGVLLATVVVGLAAHWLLGLPWLLSLLLAAVVASTDPATLIPVFKRVSIWPRLQQTVESESAFNDATASVLVFTLIGIVQQPGGTTWTAPVLYFLQSALIGLAVGLVCGLLALWLVSDKGWGIFHEYGSIVMLAVALGSYSGAEALHASGFMAAFTAGVITGNGASFRWSLARHTEENIHHFGNAITLILRMMIFVLLGAQVDFSVVSRYLVPGLAVVAVIVVFARPLVVMSSAGVDRRAKWSLRELLFMFWVRETGVIPAALSGVLMAEQVPGADVIGAVTFLAILFTILLQASTTGLVARKLGVLTSSLPEEV
ncbi:sodium:proton antiporter [Alicyclobacillus tolerans]|uniref:cation:proton antiporter n=1 Tax=Alicyclobacillus tolerans TaxID=90970 RepID=UPI001F257EB5|nr:sodium:proton antiporter [Alicyclobacillus tolerans]MCF8563428.1 sodium:proton antiporter [Alicyclobacillus tolerans]